jgi:hypothetical protein
LEETARKLVRVNKVGALILVVLTGVVACPAALEWKTTNLELTAQPGQQAMSVTFPFRNAGDRPVRILSLDPSCSCMSAAPDKEICAPGESGEIRVELAVAGYSGRVRRSIAVVTDDANGRFAELTLTVDIPELVVITPRFLFWKVGDAPEAKSAELVVADPKTTTFDGIECANSHFQTKFSVRRPGVFRLTIRPADTRQPDEAMVHLNAVVGGRSQTYVIYAAVK